MTCLKTCPSLGRGASTSLDKILAACIILTHDVNSTAYNVRTLTSLSIESERGMQSSQLACSLLGVSPQNVLSKRAAMHERSWCISQTELEMEKQGIFIRLAEQIALTKEWASGKLFLRGKYCTAAQVTEGFYESSSNCGTIIWLCALAQLIQKHQRLGTRSLQHMPARGIGVQAGSRKPHATVLYK